jgi:hypothetical protein
MHGQDAFSSLEAAAGGRDRGCHGDGESHPVHLARCRVVKPPGFDPEANQIGESMS